MSDSESPPNNKLRIFQAFCSMLLPGTGQLLQGRGTAFFGQLSLYILTALIPCFCIFLFLCEVMLPHLSLSLLIPLFLLIFPVTVIFFSVIDAVKWNLHEKSSSVLPSRKYIIGFVFVYFCMAIFLLTPAVVGSPRDAARRMQCSNNIKQIALAMHCYHDTYGSFPPAYTVDKDGKPLHSWRVLLLPYLEYQELYAEIHLDEPWDSEYNQQFHSQTPALFRCPSLGNGFLARLRSRHPRLKAECCYSVICGKETPFPGAKPTTFGDITDGTSETILVAERMVPVHWMNPLSDIPFETATCGINTELTGLGNAHGDGCNIAMADGSVHFCRETVFPKILSGQLTRGKHAASPQLPSASYYPLHVVPLVDSSDQRERVIVSGRATCGRCIPACLRLQLERFFQPTANRTE